MKKTMIFPKVVTLLIGLILLMNPAMGSAASLSLAVPNGEPGGAVTGAIGFQDVTDVAAFSLVLSFSSGSILSASASDFTRNGLAFPGRLIGGQEANFILTTSSGKFHLVGLHLDPATGPANIGQFVYHIAPGAVLGDTQVVTLAGQVYTKAGEVVDLVPASVTFTVTASPDSDHDGMLDSWEMTQFGTLARDGSGDYDGDGLSDLEEYRHSTNPKAKDSDGDGIQDGWEVAHGLNPLVNDAGQDPDGDGYSNLQEYQYGKDPNDPLSMPGGPTADAGPDQEVAALRTVKLSGANSTDPDDGIKTYLWEQIGGTAVTLSSTSAAQPTFTAPSVAADGASLLFRLTVADQGGLQSSDVCIVHVLSQNDPPVADAGGDQPATPAQTVVLNGSGSHDVDGSIASRQWTQLNGLPVSLTGPATAQPSFTSPDSWEGALTFLLTVTDDRGLKAQDACIVNVSADNTPPVSRAGADQSADAGETVTLDGSGSTDAEGAVSYRWTQTRGVPVTLSNPRAAAPSFLAPDLGASGGILEFQLTVTDQGGLKARDLCTVTVAGAATGSLQVTLGPQEAIAGGARWKVDGGEWHESGVIVKGLAPGAHSVAFLALPGWTAPADRTVTIDANNLSTLCVVYTEPTLTSLALPQTKGAPGASLTIPVTVGNAVEIYSAQFTVSFDPSVLSFLPPVRLGSLTSGWMLGANTDLPGRIVISLAGTQPLNGSGELVLLDFTIVGQAGSFAELTLEQASLENAYDETIIPRLIHGSIDVGGTYDLSGACTYFKNAGPIPGVALSLTGDGSLNTSSDAAGSFAFNDVPMGAYTLTPAKADGAGSAISALDASYVLRHVVGLITLDADQQIAADVNASGTVTALDASYILRKTVGLIGLPFTPSGKIWVFRPPQRTYSPLAGDQTAQSFTGILIGDVNGNWTPPVQSSSSVASSPEALTDAAGNGAKTAGTEETRSVISKKTFAAKAGGEEFSLNGRARLATAPAVKFDDDELSVPLKLRVLDGAVYSGELIVAYDAKRFELTGLKAGPLAREALISYQEERPGVVRIALASATPIEGVGELVSLQIKHKGSKFSKPAVEVRKAVFNDGRMKTIR